MTRNRLDTTDVMGAARRPRGLRAALLRACAALALTAAAAAMAQDADAPETEESGPLPCLAEPLPAGGDPLYALPADGAWGYVDRTGTWIVEPAFDQAEPFSEGRAAVEVNGAWGVIDRSGEWVLEPSLGSQSYVEVDGRRVGTPPLKPFSHGCAAAVADVAVGPPFFVDRDGGVHWREARTEALAAYDVREFGRFREGKAWFRGFDMEDGHPHGWIDVTGAIVLEPTYAGVGDFVGGLAPAAIDDDNWGFIDHDGELTLPRKWTLSHARPFSEGLAPVDIGTYDYAYLDRDGNFVRHARLTGDHAEAHGTEVSFGAIGPFADGLAPVETGFLEGNLFAYVRPDGSVAFVPDDLEGITVCNRASLPAYRDGLVRWVVARDGRDCGEGAFNAGLAEYDDAQYVYVDTEGEVVLRQGDD